MASSSLSQAVMEECFTHARLVSVESFAFKCRQCTDIADLFAEIGPKFRFPVWESYMRDQSKGGAAAAAWSRCEQAMKNFCRAVKEAEVFLQHHCCTSAGKNDWKLCANALAKLDTGEAYDVHLQNMIWSKAALQAAIFIHVADSSPSAPRSSVPRHGLISSDDVEKLVAECRRMLCRYASSYKEKRILMDRLDFNESIQSFINGGTINDASKYLTYLLRKSQQAAWRQKSSTASVDAYEVSEHEFESADREQELGKGSFAKRPVYSTLWLGRIRVAVKVISIDCRPSEYIIDTDEGAAEQLDIEEGGAAAALFKAEVSLLAMVQSPYIVQLMGWAIDRSKKEGKLVMELVETDLEKVLQDNREGLPLHVAVDVMLQVSKAMEYLHGQNIIHRDIKPSNILLESSPIPDFWRVKVCDFGIAKTKLQQGALYSTFKVGTMWYRSPEVLSEKVKYSNRADVYSFAITCSEMLGGFSATVSLSKGEGSLLNRILSNQRPRLPAHCPAHLSDLITKCWHNDPDKRPPFREITSTLSYIKFLLMRGPEGVKLNAASGLLTPFDEYELKACISGAAQKELAVRADPANWETSAEFEALVHKQGPVLQQGRTRRWLQSGEILSPTESLICGRYRLTMQKDGNLVLLDCDEMICLWASGCTPRRSISGLDIVCKLMSNGNLVIRSGKEPDVWSSGSAGSRVCSGSEASYKLELDFDGRAFISGPNGGTTWATERKVLNSGDLLHSSNSLRNNGFQFSMQDDGNLVLYNEQHKALWASGTNNRTNWKKCWCTLQDDGLLAILNGDQQVWSSNESGSIACYTLELQSDGNVVIVHPSGTSLWETLTGNGRDDSD